MRKAEELPVLQPQRMTFRGQQGVKTQCDPHSISLLNWSILVEKYYCMYLSWAHDNPKHTYTM